MKGTSVAAGLLFLVLLPGPASALWTSEGESHYLDLGGSIRTIAQGFRHSESTLLFGDDDELDALSVTLLRMTASGKAGSRLSGEFHGVQGLTYSTFSGSGVGVSSSDLLPLRFRMTDAAWDWAENDHVTAAFAFDRFNLSLSLPDIEITLGRQAVNFSLTYFWNPLDVFLPFRPEQFDRDYKAGVDALRVDVSLGALSGFTLVAAGGRRLDIVVDPAALDVRVAAEPFCDEPWFGSAVVGRGFTNLWDWDLVVQGGKVYGGLQAGGGFSGEVFTIGMRGEAAYFWATEDRQAIFIPGSGRQQLLDDHARVVVGIDRRFENSLYFTMEYFFNEAGGDEDDLLLSLARLAIGENQSLSEHSLGFLASYEILPILRAQMIYLLSLSDHSSLVFPSLHWQATGELEILGGAMIGVGDRPRNGLMPRSEYGTLENIFFGEIKWYF